MFAEKKREKYLRGSTFLYEMVIFTFIIVSYCYLEDHELLPWFLECELHTTRTELKRLSVVSCFFVSK